MCKSMIPNSTAEGSPVNQGRQQPVLLTHAHTHTHLEPQARTCSELAIESYSKGVHQRDSDLAGGTGKVEGPKLPP